MSPRDRLAALLAPDVLDALEALVEERVDERLRVLSARRMNGRQRTEFVTIVEAAELMRCKRQRVDDLLSAGRLTRYKDGARTLVKRAELEAHLAGDQRKA